MEINGKIIGCNDRPGQESIDVTFPERTGQVITLAISADAAKSLAAGSACRLVIDPPADTAEVDDA
jgi:hypothetical protein